MGAQQAGKIEKCQRGTSRLQAQPKTERLPRTREPFGRIAVRVGGRYSAMGDMDDIIKDFLVESNENLDQLHRDLVTLEKDPTAREVLASIFRTIHTIKGTTGFLGFSRLESVAHVG